MVYVGLFMSLRLGRRGFSIGDRYDGCGLFTAPFHVLFFVPHTHTPRLQPFIMALGELGLRKCRLKMFPKYLQHEVQCAGNGSH